MSNHDIFEVVPLEGADERLRENLFQLLLDDAYFDVTIGVMTGKGMKYLNAHRSGY